MKAYYAGSGVTIYHGYSLQVVQGLERSALVITDPPYGDTSLGWDKRIDHWPAEIVRACLPNASLWCFGSLRMFYESDFSPWKLAQDIVWEKHNGSSFHADRFKRVHEHVVQFYLGEWSSVYKSPVCSNDATARTVRRKQRPPHMGEIDGGFYRSEDGGPRLETSVQYFRSCHGSAVHPTQKPVDLIALLLKYSAAPGMTVLDPFMGSGSTLVACKRFGIPAVGIEIDERYCEAAARRPKLVAQTDQWGRTAYVPVFA